MASLQPEDLDIAKLPRGPLGHLKTYAVADLLQRATSDYREALEQKEQLGRTVEELALRVDELTAQVASLEAAAARRKDSDELAGTLFASAQRAAREAREAAREESELMLKKARRRAEQIEEDAAGRAEARVAEIARLEALREEVAARLRATLEAIAGRHGTEATNGSTLDGAVVPAPTRP